MKLGMKKCEKSTSSQQEQFESWMGSIESISDLIIEAREEIDNDRCLPKKVLTALHNAKTVSYTHLTLPTNREV